MAGVDIDDTLEIGPLNNPGLTGPGVRYFDVLDQSALRAHAIEEGLDPAGCPEIHFVSPVGDLGVVDRTFANVYSSHAIEHQPDLVAHLQGVERILRRNGRYFLAVPDKRFCFDHFNPETSLEDVLAAYRVGRHVHSAASVREARLNTTHNDPLRHWLKLHGKPGFFSVPANVVHEDMAKADAGEYLDVHAWKFTPHGFASIVRNLVDMGIINLEFSEVYDTGFGELEFFAVLRKL
ncbi:MAG: hypothetical protein AVDCRST_MAG91-798 [uncultured Sphingomonadaceae bacterium]|uniref:Methyltransferase type 11 domain-containing protein n=1 Tax=uncultured Sphingomonadaceae bacterium TaxID=169976 RepID=A0A6J4SD65_9SPHN|nr:MAG: hypothetical protein AVDCRST_MAG91-798 [uncultured Sphingomonadaceae bacterium]